ncbi:hypothetical protein [Streptomyces sp. NPDC001536]|uniref:hypothetical protein n=1 Tax=Streptomyces sp. NPDC001536 TaxID=3364583 RepID=UPI00367E9E7B
MTRPRLAERYWASLTDSRAEALDHLIEHGRRRDLPFWRRYVASLLDVEVVEERGLRERDLGAETVVPGAPTSTVHYTLDATVEVGETVPAGRDRRLLPAIALAAALCMGIGLSAALSLFGTGHQAASSPATPTVLPSPTAVESVILPSSAAPSGVYEEGDGYAWAPPEDWQRSENSGAEVHYTSPDGKQELVAKSALARGDLLETWRTSEQDAQDGTGYRKIRLDATEFRDHPAVVWEYTFTLDGVPWHARLLGFSADGRSYQINTWYQPGIESQALEIYDEVKASFTVL